MDITVEGVWEVVHRLRWHNRNASERGFVVHRLNQHSSVLAALIESAQPETQRMVAVSVSQFIVPRVGLVNQIVNNALVELLAGVVGDTPIRKQLGCEVDVLDEIYWNLRDETTSSAQSHSVKYTLAFAHARAAASVWFATSEDPREAAMDATYEAAHAFRSWCGATNAESDPQEVDSIVYKVFSREQE